jgi:Flp pilus assembly protein TadD
MIAMFVSLGAGASQASIFHHDPKAEATATDAGIAEIDLALSERRLVDAGRLLEQAALAGVKDPRLTLLNGQLDLIGGHYADARTEFQVAEKSPVTHARAMEGAGIALSLLGRSDDAVAELQKAVLESPTSWRAWDALGCEYDLRRAWSDAEHAYGEALKTSDAPAIVLNNRGFSRLLQHRVDEAVNDLTAALQKKPDFAEARTNLRLALALKGDYTRAASNGGEEDRAALLNNAGFAAALKGDYAQAEDLLGQAIKARSVYYDKASENLGMVRAMADRDKSAVNASH